MTSGLTHLACFTFVKLTLVLVVHTKCWKGAFCMDYEAKFAGKTSGISQA